MVICTGITLCLTVKGTRGPRHPSPLKFSAYSLRMVSLVSSPGGGRLLLAGIIMRLEGQGAVFSWTRLSLIGLSGPLVFRSHRTECVCGGCGR